MAVVKENNYLEHKTRDSFTQMGTICLNDYKCEIMLLEVTPEVLI
jgi:hypothetical protein